MEKLPNINVCIIYPWKINEITLSMEHMISTRAVLLIQMWSFHNGEIRSKYGDDDLM
jgi:hypothetical protein